jgi:antitoxin ParD1/3/4
MEVTLTPEQESVLDRIAQATGTDKSQVLKEALDHWLAREQKLAKLRADVQIGLDQIERGEYTEYTEETLKQLFESIKREARQRHSCAK